MKNRITAKLRSRAGASVVLAMLLFLVCAVLCSVILTAGTAASGRMSKIAESDQRYYAVTSAAELLKDLMGDQSVSIVLVEEIPSTVTYTGGVAGTPVEGTPVVNTYIVPGKRAEELDPTADYSVVNHLGNVSYRNDSIPKDAAQRIYGGDTLTQRELTLTSDFYAGAGLDYDVLAVTVLEDLDAQGNLTLTLCNRYGSKGTASTAGERYALTLVFQADRSETVSTKTEHVTSTALSEDSYTEGTVTTKTTVTTLTWRLAGIKTDS